MSVTTAVLFLCLIGLSQAFWGPPRTTKKPVFPFGMDVPDYSFNSLSPDYDYRQPNKQQVRKLGGVGPLTVDKLYLDNHVQADKVFFQDYYNYDYPEYKNSYIYRDYPSYGKSGLGLVKKIRSGRHGKK
uniref:Uncharacterized protein n=1 Tax=Ditylenchus dipsaci TaxID=166011 RepID=A0A915EFG3_9BILA